MNELPLSNTAQKRSDGRSLIVVVFHIVFVLAPIYLGTVSKPSGLLVLLWLWFGFGMNGLLNLMHECAHYHVFRSRRGSNFLGGWVLAPLAFADFEGYRQRHWQHHRHLGTSEDTKDSHLTDIRGMGLIRLLFRCLFLVEAFKKFLHQMPENSTGESRLRNQLWVIRVLIVQTLLFSSMVGFAYWVSPRTMLSVVVASTVAYLAVYVYGLTTLTVFAATLRAIAEHQIDDTDGFSTSGHAVLRNLRCSVLTRFLFGAYGFAEHATHHRWPSVPYYQLPGLTVQAGLSPIQGYAGTLWKFTRPRQE